MQLLGPAIYHWSSLLSIPTKAIKKEWTCVHTAAEAAVAGKRSADDGAGLSFGPRGSAKKLKRDDEAGEGAGRKRRLVLSDDSEEEGGSAEQGGGKRKPGGVVERAVVCDEPGLPQVIVQGLGCRVSGFGLEI